jgi:ATP-dependent Clp protease ATP-binding subunit ClpX
LTSLQPLDKEALRRILTEPKNALVKQYIKLFKMDHIDLSFDDTVLDFIVDKALEFKLGARGLRSILENIMTDAMFDSPSDHNAKHLHITLEYASEKLQKTNIAKLKVA